MNDKKIGIKKFIKKNFNILIIFNSTLCIKIINKVIINKKIIVLLCIRIIETTNKILNKFIKIELFLKK